MAILRKSHVSDSASRIRTLFHEALRKKGSGAYPSTIGPALDALFDAVGAAMDEKAQAGPITLGSLVTLTKAPSRYSGQGDVDVKVQLTYLPRSGWKLSRDAADGGGPYVDGEWSPTPDEAIKSFMDLIEKRYAR